MLWGIEVEIENAPAGIVTVLNRRGLDLTYSDDGSCRGFGETWAGTYILPKAGRWWRSFCSNHYFGLELKTRPLSDIKAAEVALELDKALKGIPYSPRASIHIHADYRNLPWVKVKDLILDFCKFEQEWYTISTLGIEHRGLSNDFRYCRPLSSPIGVQVGDSIVPLFSMETLKEADTATNLAALWGRLDLVWKRNRHYVPHRLHGLNITNLISTGSVEIRVFNAVYGRIHEALDIFQTFVYASLQGIDRERPNRESYKKVFGLKSLTGYKRVALPEYGHTVLHHYTYSREVGKIEPIVNRLGQMDDGTDSFCW
jgi:hypothetical protein